MTACRGCRLRHAITLERNTPCALLCVRVCICVQYGTAAPNMAAAESLFMSKAELHSYDCAILRLNRGCHVPGSNPLEMSRGVSVFLVAVPSRLLKDKAVAKLEDMSTDELEHLSCSFDQPLAFLPTKLVDAGTVPICLCPCISVMGLPGGWEVVVQAPGGPRINIGWADLADVAWDDLKHKEVSNSSLPTAKGCTTVTPSLMHQLVLATRMSCVVT